MWIDRYKLLWIALIALILLNGATIATVFMNRQKSMQRAKLVLAPNRTPLNVEKIFETTNFNREQKGAFIEALEQFKESNRDVNKKIKNLQRKYWSHLNKDTVCSDSLDVIWMLISEQNRVQRRLTSEFYISISEGCTTEQKSVLKKEFAPLFIKENDVRNREVSPQRRGEQEPLQRRGEEPLHRRGE